MPRPLLRRRAGRGAALRGATLPLGLSMLLFGAGAGAGAVDEAVTFSEHVAPVIHRRCLECHRRGEPAPFAFETFAQVQRRAGMILEVVEDGTMPPWHAVGGDVPLAGDRRLAPGEVDLLRAWIEAGAPEGDPARLPPFPEFPDEWRLGEPDLVLEMPEAFEVPADGPDIYRNFVIPIGLGDGRWLKAIEFRPSRGAVVHHSLFYLDASGAARRADEADPGPGFAEMPLDVGMGRFLGGWVPGATARPLPEGLAFAVPAGADLVLSTHFHPSGKPESERSRVALHFTDRAPEREFIGIQLPPVFGAFAGIDLPAGDPGVVIEDRFTLPVPVEAFGATAHAHYLGKALRLVAERPDGNRTVLLDIPDWDIAWQEEYRFVDPVVLPAGTRLVATVVWDNSAANADNPSDPPVRVRWGRESLDEMGSLTLMATTPSSGQMKRLRAAYTDHLRWQVGSHLLEPDRIGFAGRLRQRALERFDRDGDGELDPSEAADARAVLDRAAKP